MTDAHPELRKILCVTLRRPFACAQTPSRRRGIETLTRTLAQGVAGAKIRVGAIAPGAVRINLKRATSQGDAGERLRALVLYGRLWEVEDIAPPACRLPSDETDCVVGHVLLVDGGTSFCSSFPNDG